MKRFLDVVLSGIALVVLAPVLLVIVVSLRVTHGKPVFFRQVRVGLREEQFTLHKFRSMTDSPGLAVTAGNDPRVHKIGRWLRASKLDELPQLWDVFRGAMSIVGPRPEVPEFVEHWPSDLRPVIVSVRPGITDPASIHFRHESEILAQYPDPRSAYIDVVLPKKCELYVEYVNNQSLLGDFKIILQTAQALVQKTSNES